MAISYSCPHYLGVPHGIWKEGEKGFYTFTPHWPRWIRSRHVLKGMRSHQETTRARTAARPVRARAQRVGGGGSNWAYVLEKIRFLCNRFRLPRFSPPFMLVFLVFRLPLNYGFSFVSYLSYAWSFASALAIAITVADFLPFLKPFNSYYLTINTRLLCAFDTHRKPSTSYLFSSAFYPAMFLGIKTVYLKLLAAKCTRLRVIELTLGSNWLIRFAP